MPAEHRWWSYLNSELGRLLLGFALTAVVGGGLTQWFQDRSWRKQREFEQHRQDMQWERDRRFEMLRRKLDEGQKSLEEISDLMSTRLYRMRRLFALLRGGSVATAETEWPAYVDVVERWNVKLGIYQNKVRELVSDSMARALNNYETDSPGLTTPRSIHGKFFVASRLLEALRQCTRKPACSPAPSDVGALAAQLNDLDFATDGFIDGASDQFLTQASALEQARIAE